MTRIRSHRGTGDRSRPFSRWTGFCTGTEGSLGANRDSRNWIWCGRREVAPCHEAYRETFELPAGFGLRQPSGALEQVASVTKAVDGHRSPRRYRGNASSSRFLATVCDAGIVTVRASHLAHGLVQSGIELVHRCLGFIAHVRDAEGLAFDFSVTAVNQEALVFHQRL